jgi:uncharacterized membrane protein
MGHSSGRHGHGGGHGRHHGGHMHGLGMFAILFSRFPLLVLIIALWIIH